MHTQSAESFGPEFGPEFGLEVLQVMNRPDLESLETLLKKSVNALRRLIWQWQVNCAHSSENTIITLVVPRRALVRRHVDTP
jgi:hypothetical protein